MIRSLAFASLVLLAYLIAPMKFNPDDRIAHLHGEEGGAVHLVSRPASNDLILMLKSDGKSVSVSFDVEQAEDLADRMAAVITKPSRNFTLRDDGLGMQMKVAETHLGEPYRLAVDLEIVDDQEIGQRVTINRHDAAEMISRIRSFVDQANDLTASGSRAMTM